MFFKRLRSNRYTSIQFLAFIDLIINRIYNKHYIKRREHTYTFIRKEYQYNN